LCHSWIPAEKDDCDRCEKSIQRLEEPETAQPPPVSLVQVAPVPDVPPPVYTAPGTKPSRRGLKLDLSPAPEGQPREMDFSGLAQSLQRSNSSLQMAAPAQQSDILEDLDDELEPPNFLSCNLDEVNFSKGPKSSSRGPASGRELSKELQSALQAHSNSGSSGVLSQSLSPVGEGGDDELVVSDDDDVAPPHVAPQAFLSCEAPVLPPEVHQAMLGGQAPPSDFFQQMNVSGNAEDDTSAFSPLMSTNENPGAVPQVSGQFVIDFGAQ